MERLRRIVLLFWVAGAFGAVGLLMLAAAVVIAWYRFADCGPSALHAANATCTVGARLLLVAYGVLSVALVLGAASLTLLWKERREHRRASRR